MARVVPLKDRSMRERVSAEEWDTRVDLAACYRLVALYGMADLVYNHITARVPGSDDHVLINPYGMLYDEITASSLIKIDLEGNTVLQPDHDAQPWAAGMRTLHSAGLQSHLLAGAGLQGPDRHPFVRPAIARAGARCRRGHIRCSVGY